MPKVVVKDHPLSGIHTVAAAWVDYLETTMSGKLNLPLAMALVMFPQVVETIYSPALPSIASGYGISAATAGLTLSLYFVAFAVGIVIWGRLCDLIGRRPAMLSGLALYGVGPIVALFSPNFEILLLARMISAIGAATGSIGTQTILRDSFQGPQLAKVFSSVGIAVALSPAIGMAVGAVVVHLTSYTGVFLTLAVLAIVLITWTSASLAETRPANVQQVSFWNTVSTMIKDGRIWYSAFLIALFNLSLFSYCQLAPFHLEQLGYGSGMMGASGVLLSLGTLLGAMANRKLLHKGWKSDRLVSMSCLVATAGGLLVALLSSYLLFVVPMALIAFAFALAIPNILAPALRDYSDCLGTAGAIFGMKYYLLLGAGLWLSGLYQDLVLVLLASGIGALIIVMLKPGAAEEQASM